MTPWLRTMTVCVWLLLAGAPAWAQIPEGWDRYLGRHRGPYRGQILESQTKAPLAGAVVVALWRRDVVYPFQVNSEHYAVRETVTDSDGRFVMEVRDIEEGAPRRTRKPEFLVFLPGYGAFPHNYTAPEGFIAELFYGAGATVEIPRMETREERLRNLSSFGPHDYSKSPHQDLPRLMRAIDQERVAAGLSPYRTPEKQ